MGCPGSTVPCPQAHEVPENTALHVRVLCLQGFSQCYNSLNVCGMKCHGGFALGVVGASVLDFMALLGFIQTDYFFGLQKTSHPAESRLL